jgi:parvulin-like peptidyl-prolyl isomerase
MRKLLWLAVLVVAGCSDVFSTRADVVATAADHELTAEQLGNWLSRIKGLNINADAAEFLANVWLDYTLIAEAVAQGTLPEDSASVAAVMWPDVAEIKADRWYDHLIASRNPLTEASADSVYASDSIRIFQHVLFSVAPSATESIRQATRAEARRVMNEARRGANFAALAAEYSGDPSSRNEGGYLPPSPRGSFVAQFDSAGWLLDEGEISGLVFTTFGIHIIKRPSRDEVRRPLLDWLRELAEQRLDSIYLIELGERKNLRVSSNAPALMRQSLDDERGMLNSRKSLASYDGGDFTVADFLRWMPALGPTAARQVRVAADEQLTELALQLGRNRLILNQADSAGMTLNELQWLGIKQKYDASIDTLRLLLRLGDDVSNTTITAAQRSQVVRLKIDGYFDRVAAGQAALMAPPPALPHVLRSRESYNVSMDGVHRATEVANERVEQRGKAPSPLQPAPGGPPLGGGEDTVGGSSTP